MKTTIKALLGFLLITILGFAISNNPQERELIIGKWNSEGCSSCIWEFKEDGKCYDYYKGRLDTTYNWEITYHKTPSGLTFGHLTLINVDDPKDIYEYRINGLGEKGMHLEYNTGVGLSQLFFERQDKG